MSTVVVALVAACAALPASTSTPQGAAVRSVVDASGHRIVSSVGPALLDDSVAPESVLWVYQNTVGGIPESVSLNPAVSAVYSAEVLNNARLQRFDLPGDNAADFTLGTPGIVAVSAARTRDFVAVLSRPTSFIVQGFTSASATPVWSFNVPAQFNSGGVGSIATSSDGSRVAVGVSTFDSNTQTGFGRLFVLDALTGQLITTWTTAQNPAGQPQRFLNAVSISGDGSRVLVTDNDTARVIDVASSTATFSASVVGSGGRFKISTDGNTIALGGFDFKVFRFNGSSWVQRVTFSGGSEWYGGAIALSGDGLTAAVRTFRFTDYLATNSRVFDVASGTLLGTFSTLGTGTLQDTATSGAASDDGSVIALSSWGLQDNAFPETLILNRSAQLIGSIDSRGSVFTVDVSPDGQYVAVGTKATHANTLGSGGDVTVFRTAPVCRADCDGNGTVDINDFFCYLTLYAGNNAAADINGDAVVDINDFFAFLTLYAAGC